MQEENSKIPFSIRLKEDGSYAFAEAKLTNTVSSLQIAKKAADYGGGNNGGGNSEEIG